MMFKYAKWNKGLKTKRAYSAQHKKVVQTFDHDCKICDKGLIPSHNQDYYVRQLKAKR